MIFSTSKTCLLNCINPLKYAMINNYKKLYTVLSYLGVLVLFMQYSNLPPVYCCYL